MSGLGHGFAMATISSGIWYFTTGNLHNAVVLGSLLVAERIFSLTVRPFMDWLKRLPDGFLAQRIKLAIPWFTSSVAWKVCFDIVIGMTLIHAPRHCDIKKAREHSVRVLSITARTG